MSTGMRRNTGARPRPGGWRRDTRISVGASVPTRRRYRTFGARIRRFTRVRTAYKYVRTSYN